jgi:hypothetical protein
MATHYTELNFNYDEREQIILGTILAYQLENPVGIQYGDLWKKIKPQKIMCYQTFNRKLSALIEDKDSIIEREVIKNKRWKPTLYRIKKIILFNINEQNEILDSLYVQKETDSFIHNIQSLDTNTYVKAVMEFLFGRLTLVAITVMLYDNEKIQEFSLYSIRDNIVNLISSIGERGKNREEKEKIFNALFEILEPFSSRPIGKSLQLDKIYEDWIKIKQKINMSK